MPRPIPTSTLALLLALLLVLPAACTPETGLEGKYQAQAQDGKTVTLTLKPDHTGEWDTATDNVPVRWEMRGGELLLHSKGGGVVRAAVVEGTLRVNLPGEGELVFRRPGR